MKAMPEQLSTTIGPVWYNPGDLSYEVVKETGRPAHPAKMLAIAENLAEGDTFVDIGAHVGALSVMAATIVGNLGSVIAIEPSFRNSELVIKNLEPFRNSIYLQAAVVERFGWLELHESSESTDDNRTYAHEDANSVVHVPGFPLDHLELSELKVLKISTQGIEYRAIAGAIRTIKRCKPIMILDYWPEGIIGAGHEPLKVLKVYANLLDEDYLPPESLEGFIPSEDSNSRCSLMFKPRNV